MTYKSVLELNVKRGVPSTHPDFDIKKCWYCQENDRIKTPQMSKIWCMRCYILVNTKHDGTMIEQDLIGVGKDLAKINKDLAEGKAVYESFKREQINDEIPEATNAGYAGTS